MIVTMTYFRVNSSSFPEPFGVFSTEEIAREKMEAAEKTERYSPEIGEFHMYTHILDKPDSDDEQLKLHKGYIVRLQNEINDMEAENAMNNLLRSK